MIRLAVVPAYQAERTVGDVVRGLVPLFDQVWVLDDGSTDRTAAVSREAGAEVLSHRKNRGKGAALHTLLAEADRRGIDAIVTLDADGQHLPDEAARLDREVEDRSAVVLGVRDLVLAAAPGANQRGNSISNYWISLFSGRAFRDTNCGLRRYPVKAVRALGVSGPRFSFEAEVVLRASLAGLTIIEHPVRVLYPADRTTHFHVVRDPARIVRRVVATVVSHHVRRLF
jgi:glycosyltransferase involved in cell wall biosynthesis